MNQPDLFSCAPRQPYGGEAPYQSHSATSKAAATEIKHKIGPMHARIIAHLYKHHATDEQLGYALDIGGNTLRPRRRELQLMGIIVDSGKTRPCRSGRAATIWRLANE